MLARPGWWRGAQRFTWKIYGSQHRRVRVWVAETGRAAVIIVTTLDFFIQNLNL
jgi:hypothetical protein